MHPVDGRAVVELPNHMQLSTVAALFDELCSVHDQNYRFLSSFHDNMNEKAPKPEYEDFCIFSD